MTPDILFQIANPLALLGWIALLFYPFAPLAIHRLAGIAIPLVLSFGYAVFIGLYFFEAEGGFDSLANVMLLFDNPGAALAGWVHFLAFDLFIGAWIAGQARDVGVPHLLIVPVFVATFMLGPIGLLLWFALRSIWTARATFSTEV